MTLQTEKPQVAPSELFLVAKLDSSNSCYILVPGLGPPFFPIIINVNFSEIYVHCCNVMWAKIVTWNEEGISLKCQEFILIREAQLVVNKLRNISKEARKLELPICYPKATGNFVTDFKYAFEYDGGAWAD